MAEKKTLEVDFSDFSSGTKELLGSKWYMIDPTKIDILPETKRELLLDDDNVRK